MDSMNVKGSEIIDLMHASMMEQPFQKTKNIDDDFLFNMIPHHQASLDVSKKILEYTKDDKINCK
ncbi:hypothetical protein BHAMNSH16_08810 [Brachyspira hampsonii]|uniref:DUF305 domain-containing protein n=3 Tax=Brachyspira hampsonii TaxID=1287055 RepID=A0AAC9XLB5_9SPIR|nr:hypothetical protein BHAMNSH16_08810 [Brachyspira hampsonii]